MRRIPPRFSRKSARSNFRRMKTYKAALFDLDGTLADNYAAIHSALSESFLKYGVPAPTYDEVFKTVGGSILITARKILAAHGNDEALAQPVCEHYLKIFPDRMFDGLRPMPFAREIVAAIKSRGMKTACFTNKQQEGADAIVEKLGFELDAVIGTSLHSPRKPEPAFTERALGILGVSAGSAVGVGDSEYDYLAARGAGVDSALVATGADSAPSLSGRCPECLGVYENLADLAAGVFGIAL